MGSKKSNLSKIVWSLLKPKFLLPVIGILVVIIAALFVKNVFTTESKSTKLGFEDIGELTTQSAYITEVNVSEDARDLFGLEIPFTQSKTIFSYDVVVKAGTDFSNIKWNVDDNAKTISVTLPEFYISSTDLQTDSFKLYHEAESIFTPITVEDINASIADLTKNAQQTALDNGILEEAEANAKELLTGFIGQDYDLEEYTLTFN